MASNKQKVNAGEDYRVIKQLDRSEEVSAWTESYLAVSPEGRKIIISYLDKDKILTSHQFDARADESGLAENEESVLAREEELIEKAGASYERKEKEFIKNARWAMGVTHPHIGKVYKVGFDDQRKQQMVIMEYIPGLPIFNATRGMTPLAMSPLWMQGLDALSYLHGVKYVLHLNLKSRRIRVEIRDDGTHMLRLTDCGYGIAIEEARQKGIFRGTPNYMPTEVALGKKDLIGPASDLQSFGMLMYYCITGNHPFPGRRVCGRSLEKLARIARDEDLPLPPKAINDACPRGLSDIVMNLIQKDPADRVYKTAIEVTQAYKREYPQECKEEPVVDKTITFRPTPDDK